MEQTFRRVDSSPTDIQEYKRLKDLVSRETKRKFGIQQVKNKGQISLEITKLIRLFDTKC